MRKRLAVCIAVLLIAAPISGISLAWDCLKGQHLAGHDCYFLDWEGLPCDTPVELEWGYFWDTDDIEHQYRELHYCPKGCFDVWNHISSWAACSISWGPEQVHYDDNECWAVKHGECTTCCQPDELVGKRLPHTDSTGDGFCDFCGYYMGD